MIEKTTYYIPSVFLNIELIMHNTTHELKTIKNSMPTKNNKLYKA